MSSYLGFMNSMFNTPQPCRLPVAWKPNQANNTMHTNRHAERVSIHNNIRDLVIQVQMGIMVCCHNNVLIDCHLKYK